MLFIKETSHERLGSGHNEVCTVQGERCPCFTLHRSHDQDDSTEDIDLCCATCPGARI
ncbi:hypothetical protein BDV34DRAFT_200946 [Aspergillus parasiticus]|uniref:Uncharacterized protein n=1 Tax=Aspergillus parasiticus TaxID=5067 RepID=A0A5N6DBP1_ASPPA|nr:hypothetical protein BDV34DRAFT_200946 [Aspergillus parasiticus]